MECLYGLECPRSPRSCPLRHPAGWRGAQPAQPAQRPQPQQRVQRPPAVPVGAVRGACQYGSDCLTGAACPYAHPIGLCARPDSCTSPGCTDCDGARRTPPLCHARPLPTPSSEKKRSAVSTQQPTVVASSPPHYDELYVRSRVPSGRLPPAAPSRVAWRAAGATPAARAGRRRARGVPVRRRLPHGRGVPVHTPYRPVRAAGFVHLARVRASAHVEVVQLRCSLHAARRPRAPVPPPALDDGSCWLTARGVLERRRLPSGCGVPVHARG